MPGRTSAPDDRRRALQDRGVAALDGRPTGIVMATPRGRPGGGGGDGRPGVESWRMERTMRCGLTTKAHRGTTDRCIKKIKYRRPETAELLRQNASTT